MVNGVESEVSRSQFLRMVASAGAAGAVLTLVPALAQVSLAAPDRMKFYPKVEEDDTHRGIHWSAYYATGYGGSDDPEMPYKALEKVLKPMGYHWIKGLFLPESVHKEVGINFGTIMRSNGVMPVMRDYRRYSATTAVSESHLEGILQGVHSGIPYWQLVSEPNNKDQWPKKAMPAPERVKEAVDKVMRLWVPPSQKIIEEDGYPLLPDPCPGGDINDIVWMRKTFEWLKGAGLLDMLDPLRHNGRSAVIGIQLYSGRTDEGRNSDGSIKFGVGYDGFLKHRVYQNIARQFVDFDVPIIVTEGGPDVTVRENPMDDGSLRVPNPNFADVYMAIAKVQSSSERPRYLLNTADFLAVANLDPKRTWHEYALLKENLSPSTLGVEEVQEQLAQPFLR